MNSLRGMILQCGNSCGDRGNTNHAFISSKLSNLATEILSSMSKRNGWEAQYGQQKDLSLHFFGAVLFYIIRLCVYIISALIYVLNIQRVREIQFIYINSYIILIFDKQFIVLSGIYWNKNCF